MRNAWVLVLLLVLVGGGLAWLLLRGDGAGDRRPSEGMAPVAEEQLAPEDRYLRVPTTTLLIRVAAPDGTVPEGAEVGYVWRGRTRWLYAGEDGSRAFADAPLGRLAIVARAPGYDEARTEREMLAGVPSEVHLVVHPTPP